MNFARASIIFLLSVFFVISTVTVLALWIAVLMIALHVAVAYHVVGPNDPIGLYIGTAVIGFICGAVIVFSLRHPDK